MGRGFVVLTLLTTTCLPSAVIAQSLINLPAAAASPGGAYFFGASGVNFASPMYSAAQAAEITTMPNVAAAFGLGWHFSNGLRAEIEGSYRQVSIQNIFTRRINGVLMPISAPAGRVAATAVMANVKYDIPVKVPALHLQPYIGGGAGFSAMQFQNAGGFEPVLFQLPRNNTYTGPATISYGDATGFAYQAIAGFSIPVPSVPGLEAIVEYRYFGTLYEAFPKIAIATPGTVINGVVPAAVGQNKFVIRDQSVMFGLRYNLPGQTNVRTN